MEAALRSYTGDDPLDPWDQYIKWTEQAYPSGGKESNLQVLLEKCVAAFKNEQRYKNDVRYVGCWIKLVCFRPGISSLNISKIWNFAWWDYDMDKFAVTPCNDNL